mgnify:FL=1
MPIGFHSDNNVKYSVSENSCPKTPLKNLPIKISDMIVSQAACSSDLSWRNHIYVALTPITLMLTDCFAPVYSGCIINF